MGQKKLHISIVVAIGNGRLHNRVLGKDNRLIWHIPDDLKRFRSLTHGKPVVMGRKTFESIVAILGHGLPGRPNIVITRDPEWKYDKAIVAHSLEEGIVKAKKFNTDEIHIGGGAEIYKQALPLVDKLYLTLIDDDIEGDSYFPEYEKEFTKKTFEEEHEWNGLTYRWIDLER
jgi:dihydrofolate reductase